MRKKATIIFIFLSVILCGAYSIPHSAYGYDDLSFSALYNPSYFGRYGDAMVNPAEFSRVEEDNLFYFTFITSESWDIDLMRRNEDLSYLQNLNTEMYFSFVGNSLSLTAMAKTWFAERNFSPDSLAFDIYNRLGIQIDWAESFDFFSFGIRIEGGGDMRRRNRPITGFVNAIENAYFASFDSLDGSEYFNLGASLAFNFEVISATYAIENIISYRSNEFFIGWNELLDTSSFAFSLRYPEFTAMGDLTLFRPKIGFSIHGNLFTLSTITFNAALEMQLMPTLSLELAAAYREYDHKVFNFNRYNGVMMFAFAVESDDWALRLMCNVDTGDFKYVYPSLSLTLMR